MKCNRCGAEIEAGEEREHLDRVLCEDCYMDVISPVRTCDPWAIHSAKSFERHSKRAGLLSATQSEILRILQQTGGAESIILLEKLNGELTIEELERELATLRHMEKVGGERKHDRVIWRLWKSS